MLAQALRSTGAHLSSSKTRCGGINVLLSRTHAVQSMSAVILSNSNRLISANTIHQKHSLLEHVMEGSKSRCDIKCHFGSNGSAV